MKDFDYNVIINRKNIKNLYIRIDDDGNVIVNANKGISDSEINDILLKKDSWIRSHVERIKSQKRITDLDGRTMHILGREYEIKVIKNNKDNVSIMGKYVILESKEDNVDHHITILNNFLKKIFMHELSDHIIEECKTVAARLKIRTDFNLTVKLMKSRFGSYSSKTHRICLNYCLVKYDEEIIKSVVYHEMAHIRYMNHGRYFYRLLYKMCPGYDACNRYLKKDFKYSEVWFLE